MDVISIPVHNRVHWDLFLKKNIKCKNAYLYCSYLSAKMSLTTEMYNVYDKCIFLIYVILIYIGDTSPHLLVRSFWPDPEFSG